jgi:DNA-binding transcriptional regulator YiaG
MKTKKDCQVLPAKQYKAEDLVWLRTRACCDVKHFAMALCVSQQQLKQMEAGTTPIPKTLCRLLDVVELTGPCKFIEQISFAAHIDGK